MAAFDLDQLIREVGPFGRYQLTNYLLICVPIMITTMYTLTYIFTGGDLVYRCKIDQCDQVDNGSGIINPLQSSFLNFTIPMEDNGKWSKCNKFPFINNNDDNRPQGDNFCGAEHFNQNSVIKCDEFVYQSDEQTILSSFDLTCDQEWKLSLLGTINNVGQFVCMPLTGFISDRYGRKNAFIMGILAAGVLGFIRAFSVNYVMFVIFEFLEPAFGSAVYSSGFILGKVRTMCQLVPLINYPFVAMEYVDPSKRILGTSLINIFYTMGMALLGVAALLTREWRMLLWVCYGPSVVFISYFWLLPESTRWLATKGKFNQVKKNIIKAGQINKTKFSDSAKKMLYSDNFEEFMELQPKENATEGSEKESSYPLLKAIKNKVIRKRLVILSFCWITNTFVYYGLSIYSVSFVGEKYLNYIAGCLIELPSTFITYFIADTKLLGRKRSLIGTLLISGIACLCQLALHPDEGDDAVISPGPFTLFLIGKCAITVN